MVGGGEGDLVQPLFPEALKFIPSPNPNLEEMHVLPWPIPPSSSLHPIPRRQERGGRGDEETVSVQEGSCRPLNTVPHCLLALPEARGLSTPK